MILNPNTHQAESEVIGTEETISMSIDSSDQAALMMILSENLYKDAIGSLVRESASNALDTHKEAGTTDPIIVKLEMNSSYNYVYSVQDFGTGISPEKVKNILSKYAASTKRNSNDYLGYFGLGFKAPLAYTDSFTFVTNSEGVEYTYIMYKSEDGTKIDLVGERPTKERNGTKVSIGVTRGDYYQFIAKIKEQLAYFEGIYFEVYGIDNNFKVLRHEDWKYSQLSGATGMHICLGDVYYAIDWARLGINSINLPVGLKFNIEDGLLPIPSREDIKYTEEAKTLILSKIDKVADYFVSKFNESMGEVTTFKEWLEKHNLTFVDVEGFQFNIDTIKTYSLIPIIELTIKDIELLDLEELAKKTHLFFQNYEIRGELNHSTFYGKYNSSVNLTNNYQSSSDKLIIATEAPKGVLLAYLKDEFSNAKFLYKKWDFELGGNNTWYPSSHLTYMNMLNLKAHPKNEWRQRIKEFQSIIGEYINVLPKISDLQPTPEWLQKRKDNRAKNVRKKVGNEQITLKLARIANRGQNKMAFDQGIYLLKGVGKSIKRLIIYGEKEDREKIEKMLPITMREVGGNRIALAIVNKYEVKKVQDLPNFVTIDEFMKGKSKPFKVFATAILVNRLMKAHQESFNAVHFIANFSKDLSKKMSTLVSYEGKNYPKYYYGGDDYMDEVLKIATEYNLFDEETMLIYNEVNEKLKYFDFLPAIYWNRNTAPVKQVIRELLRARKFKMDWQNYTTPTVVIEEPGDEDEEEEETYDVDDPGIATIGGGLVVVPITDLPIDNSPMFFGEEVFDEKNEEYI